MREVSMLVPRDGGAGDGRPEMDARDMKFWRMKLRVGRGDICTSGR